MTGRTELHICQGNATGLYYRDSVIEEPIVVVLRPSARECIHLSRRQCKQPIVHDRVVQNHLLLRRVTTLPSSQRSPQTCLQLGNVSGDGLTSHRTSTSLLVHSRRSGAGSPKQPLGGSSGARGVVVSCAWRRLESLLATETSVKLIY